MTPGKMWRLYFSRVSADDMSVAPCLGLRLGEQRADLGADLFDRVRRFFLAHAREVRQAGLVLRDPLLRERAVLDAPERLLHAIAHALINDVGPDRAAA